MKVILVRKDYKVGEVTTFEVSCVCEPNHDPGCCPEHNLYVEMDVKPMMRDKATVKGNYKYEVDVMIKEVEGSLVFESVSDFRLKVNLEMSPERVAYMDSRRAEAYEDKVDKLVLEKIRKSLGDKEIDAIVAKIKAEFPKS